MHNNRNRVDRQKTECDSSVSQQGLIAQAQMNQLSQQQKSLITNESFGSRTGGHMSIENNSVNMDDNMRLRPVGSKIQNILSEQRDDEG